MKRLDRNEMKNLKGGLFDDDGPICQECTSDSDCTRPRAPECRESLSCPNKPKVCAKRQLCLEDC